VRDGTCVRLAALCGRPAADFDVLPDLLICRPATVETCPLRDGGDCAQGVRFADTPVVLVPGREIASLVFCVVCKCTSGGSILAGPSSGSRPSSDATSVIRDEMTLGGCWGACGFGTEGLIRQNGTMDERYRHDSQHEERDG